MTKLRRHLSLVTALALPEWSAGPSPSEDPVEAAAAAGYEGVQVFYPEQAARAVALGMVASAVAPARSIAAIDAVAAMWEGHPIHSVTLHLGTGFETPAEARRLIEATFSAHERTGVKMLIETHRATLTQDPARTLSLIDEYPGLRFTADLSHWYTGVEFVYGDLDAKLHALGPVFERCRMIHGRISDPGCIQVAIADDDTGEGGPDYIDHFRRMWAAVEKHCTALDDEPAYLPFAVELLPASAHYARTVLRNGKREEEADRWTQADVLWRIAIAGRTVTAGVPA